MSIIEQLTGTAVPLSGDDVDTDQIIPARFLKEITFEKMGEYLFYDARFNDDGSEKGHPLNDSCYKGGSLLLVGRTFGCGSSREHAPQAIKRYGISMIVGLSFAEIFAGNCRNIGVPVVTVQPEILNQLFEQVYRSPETSFTLDLKALKLVMADDAFDISMDDAKRGSFLEGTWDSLSVLKANKEQIDAVAGRLPYVGGGWV